MSSIENLQSLNREISCDKRIFIGTTIAALVAIVSLGVFLNISLPTGGGASLKFSIVCFSIPLSVLTMGLALKAFFKLREDLEKKEKFEKEM